MEMTSIEYTPLKNIGEDYYTGLISMQMYFFMITFLHTSLYFISLFILQERERFNSLFLVLAELIYCSVINFVNQTHLGRIAFTAAQLTCSFGTHGQLSTRASNARGRTSVGGDIRVFSYQMSYHVLSLGIKKSRRSRTNQRFSDWN